MKSTVVNRRVGGLEVSVRYKTGAVNVNRRVGGLEGMRHIVDFSL